MTSIVVAAAAPPLASPLPKNSVPPPTETESPTPGPATMETALTEMVAVFPVFSPVLFPASFAVLFPVLFAVLVPLPSDTSGIQEIRALFDSKTHPSIFTSATGV